LALPHLHVSLELVSVNRACLAAIFAVSRLRRARDGRGDGAVLFAGVWVALWSVVRAAGMTIWNPGSRAPMVAGVTMSDRELVEDHVRTSRRRNRPACIGVCAFALVASGGLSATPPGTPNQRARLNALRRTSSYRHARMRGGRRVRRTCLEPFAPTRQ